MSNKIVVVDDDQGILEVIKIVLEDKGYEVLTLADSQKVQKMVVDYLPAVILIDLWMSGIDGHVITRELKSREETKNIPVIAISALNDGGRIAKEAGAEDFLAKPFNIDDLVVMVEKYIPT